VVLSIHTFILGQQNRFGPQPDEALHFSKQHALSLRYPGLSSGFFGGIAGLSSGFGFGGSGLGGFTSGFGASGYEIFPPPQAQQEFIAAPGP